MTTLLLVTVAGWVGWKMAKKDSEAETRWHGQSKY